MLAVQGSRGAVLWAALAGQHAVLVLRPSPVQHLAPQQREHRQPLAQRDRNPVCFRAWVQVSRQHSHIQPPCHSQPAVCEPPCGQQRLHPHVRSCSWRHVLSEAGTLQQCPCSRAVASVDVCTRAGWLQSRTSATGQRRLAAAARLCAAPQTALRCARVPPSRLA